MIASQKAETGKERDDLRGKPQWLTDGNKNGALKGIKRRTVFLP
jgi:hypothetical protein